MEKPEEPKILTIPFEKEGFESCDKKILLKIIGGTSEDRSFNAGEKKNLLDKVRNVLKEVERSLDLKDNEVLVCYVTLNPGSEKEKQKQIEDISRTKRYIHDNPDNIFSNRLRTEDELNEVIKKELRKRARLFESEAYLDLKIADRKNIDRETGRSTSNIRVYNDSYFAKWSGEVSMERLVEIIVEGLKTKD